MLSFMILPRHMTISADHTRLRTPILLHWFCQLHIRLVLIMIPRIDIAAKKMPPHLTTKFACQSPVGAYGLLSKHGNACPTATWAIRFLSSCLTDGKTRATCSNKLFLRWPYICDQLLQLDLMESVKENQDTMIVIFLSYNILKKDC